MTKKLSIIIPCYNEEKTIRSCLESILNQSTARENYEIIVVDNGSKDNSFSIASEISDKVILAPNKKVGAVRNLGALESTASWIAFVDADCSIDHDWIERALRLIKVRPEATFGGGIILPESTNWIERNWLLESESGNVLPKELIGCSIVIERNKFLNNRFNEDLSSGEDSELSQRLRKNSESVYITRELNVTHLGNAKDLKTFIDRQAWHAQSYFLSPKRNLKDPVFILIITTSTSFIASLVLILLKNPLWIATLLCAIGLPALLTLKRYTRAKAVPESFSDFLKSYTLDVAYIFGRAKGIVKKLTKIISN